MRPLCDRRTWQVLVAKPHARGRWPAVRVLHREDAPPAPLDALLLPRPVRLVIDAHADAVVRDARVAGVRGVQRVSGDDAADSGGAAECAALAHRRVAQHLPLRVDERLRHRGVDVARGKRGVAKDCGWEVALHVAGDVVAELPVAIEDAEHYFKNCTLFQHARDFIQDATNQDIKTSSAIPDYF